MVSKRDIERVVKEPFEMAFSITTIKSGFKKCGIFPFNRDVVDNVKMAPSTMYKTTSVDSERTEKPPNASTSSSQDADGVLAKDTDDQLTNDTGDQTSDTVSHVPFSLSSQHSLNISGFSPTLFSTPSVSMNSSICSTSSSRCPTPMVNPLVKAGLVPSKLADILAVDEPEIQPKRRIIKARVLTEDEYYDILKEKEEKELKEQRRIERERRKEEREKEKERKKKEREAKKKGKQPVKRKSKRSPTPIPSGTASDADQDHPGQRDKTEAKKKGTKLQSAKGRDPQRHLRLIQM